MMQKFRKSLKYILPVLILLMAAGLIMSRVFNFGSDTRVPVAEVTPLEAIEYEGQYVEVCGLVESADFVPQIGGEPTFLNMGGVYPNQVFTVIIWGEERDQWNIPPDEMYYSRRICVRGTVYMHRNIPQIRVYRPEQVSTR